jgi:hypothetical protein
MRSSILLASLASSTVSAETVLGAYIFSRHGDRTAKSTPPTVLTDLGYQEVSALSYTFCHLTQDNRSTTVQLSLTLFRLSRYLPRARTTGAAILPAMRAAKFMVSRPI